MARQRHILVYAVRHGTTALNENGCFRGPVDVPLDDDGVRDAYRLRYYFQPIELSYIFASSKQRAAKTAAIIAQPHKLTPVLRDQLQAWNVGEFAGKSKAENEDKLQYYVQNPDIPVPDGESLNNFKARVRPLFKEAMQIAVKAGKPVMIVTHSSLIHEIGSMLHNDHRSVLVEPGGVAAIYIEGGKLQASAIFKPVRAVGQSKVDTIS